MPDRAQLNQAVEALGSAGQVLDEAEAALPLLVLGVFVAMVIVGLMLWLMGGGLAKAACVVSGLVLGGLAGWAIGGTLAEQGGLVLPLVIGCSIIGALLAGLLFRIWVAIVGAAVLATVVPVASLVWQGSTVDAVSIDHDAVVERAMADGEAGQTPPTLWQRFNRGMDALHEQLADDAAAWWKNLGAGGRRIVYLGVFGGAAAGLVLGLLLPRLSAAVQTAIAGAVLIYTGGMGLARWQFGNDASFLPDSARAAVVAIGLITVLGVVIQWTAFRRRADK